MQVVKTIEFDYGHRVPNHESKCYSPHGHRGRVQVVVQGDLIEEHGNSQQGMVIDFSYLKEGLMDVVDGTFDHAFVVWSGDEFCNLLRHWNNPKSGERPFKIVVVDYIPTAENLAAHIFNMLRDYYAEKYGDRISVTAVHFFETPTSIATAYKADADKRQFNIIGDLRDAQNQ